MLNSEQLMNLSIEHMTRVGLIDKEIAENLGMDYLEFVRYKQSNKELYELMESIRTSRTKDVEDSLYRRCMGYDANEVHTISHKDGSVTVKDMVKHIPADVQAMKFYLTNVDPVHWKDRHTLGNDPDNPLTLASLTKDLTDVEG